MDERRIVQMEPEVAEKFYQLLRVDGAIEHFFEVRFQGGYQTAFKYDDLHWFNYDPERGVIEMEFMGTVVTIEGRGLAPELFQGIKAKRVSWVRESDTEMQDSSAFTTFIKEITILPPESESEEEEQ